MSTTAIVVDLAAARDACVDVLDSVDEGLPRPVLCRSEEQQPAASRGPHRAPV
ncbi:hypothetical protein AB6N24_13100 [Cellulomonas sp. 179-A 4D5 NHS]|uniref:hypothetical protein n=1 Tax=Cellulomonas sp. 179-A 4D5 NHS TaxID=3142378 RepID=UPI0039A223AC